MINLEGLIERPDLESGKYVMANAKIYEWPKHSDEEGTAFVSELDLNGEQLRDGCCVFFYRANSWYFHMTLLIEHLDSFGDMIESEKQLYREQYLKGELTP